MIPFLALSFLFASPAEFCAGYRQGFSAAYCQGHSVECLRSAPVPACTPKDASWQEGYDDGYSAGERAHPAHGGGR